MTDADRARVTVVDAPEAADALSAAAVAVTEASLDGVARTAPDCVVLGDPTAERVAAVSRAAPGAAVLAVTGDRAAARDAGARDAVDPATVADDPDRVARRVEDAARATAFGRLRRIAHAAADATAVVGADGDLRSVDEGFAALAGASPADLVGAPLTAVLDARHADLALGAAEGLVAEPSAVAAFEHETEAGRQLSTRVAPVVADGELDAAALAVRDVTDRELLSAEVALRAERLEEVASLVSHDLRNPLNVVSGRLRLAEETGDLSHVAPARRATDRLCTLVEDIQALARRGQRVRESDREAVGLADTARVAWSGVDTGGATLDVDPVAETTVAADPDRLRALFRRLFENVAAHAGPGARAVVEPTPEGFAVVDDGPGFADAATDRLLDPGYTTEEGRTGFGLAVVAAVANAHGWRVHVGEGPEGGARVAIDVTGGPDPP